MGKKPRNSQVRERGTGRWVFGSSVAVERVKEVVEWVVRLDSRGVRQGAVVVVGLLEVVILEDVLGVAGLDGLLGRCERWEKREVRRLAATLTVVCGLGAYVRN